MSEKLSIKFNSLTTRQSAKWFLLHERKRHYQDIKEINDDLAKLKDVELPPEIEFLAGKVRFEV